MPRDPIPHSMFLCLCKCDCKTLTTNKICSVCIDNHTGNKK